MLMFDVTVKFEPEELVKFVEKYKNINPTPVDLTRTQEISYDINSSLSESIYRKSGRVILPICDNIFDDKVHLLVVANLDNIVISSEKVITSLIMDACGALFHYNLGICPVTFYFTNIATARYSRHLSADIPDEIDQLIRNMRGGSRRSCITSSLIRARYENDIDDILHIDLMDSFKAELARIKKNKYKTFHGYPVNYLVRYEDRNLLTDILINELYENNRAVSPCVIHVDNLSESDNRSIESMYETAIGNTIVFEIDTIEKTDDDMLSRRQRSITQSMINKIIEMSKEFSDSVLTIIALLNLSDKDIVMDFAKDNNTVFVPLIPTNVTSTIGVAYLNKLAKRDGFRAFTGELVESVYTPSDLDRAYYSWKSNHLITAMGYANIDIGVKKAINYDPMKKLNDMIGLANIKETVNQIVSYFKMQKVYLEKGITTSNPCRHMVFYGNPGTAKTTIARLLGVILKQEDILKTGKFIETGRNGLVGMYVGHTAIKTIKKIRSAKGGILFIDEAYSLADKSGSFGDEAINTLVQEMDKVRDDTIIIFAGYPDKMEQFMDTNPGIRSRIGFHVKFDNYSKDELMEILLHTAKKEKFTFTEEALATARKQIENAIGTKDFGNGRFIRTLVEQAMMKQATRISKDNLYMDMETKDITTIQSEDISTMNKSMDKRKMGF